MMSNLFAMRADLSSPEMKQWQNEYLQVRRRIGENIGFYISYFQGTGCEMYTETLSTSFIGMTFSQAAETCFVKVFLIQTFHFVISLSYCQLKLLIIAIETNSEDGKPEIAINPQNVKIKNATVG